MEFNKDQSNVHKYSIIQICIIILSDKKSKLFLTKLSYFLGFSFFYLACNFYKLVKQRSTF